MSYIAAMPFLISMKSTKERPSTPSSQITAVNALGLDPSTTLHDVRWGEELAIGGETHFVWVLQISGAAPASHFRGGYAGSISERQPAMYFPLGEAL